MSFLRRAWGPVGREPNTRATLSFHSSRGTGPQEFQYVLRGQSREGGPWGEGEGMQRGPGAGGWLEGPVGSPPQEMLLAAWGGGRQLQDEKWLGLGQF